MCIIRYMYVCVCVYIYINFLKKNLYKLDIVLYKFVNMFIICQIVICNLLIIEIVHFVVKLKSVYNF